ncbi:very low-density lipoprotein receptor-like [Bolinopsis microptera]|uniref:very low-density lipoprotein receptor-like n=1 Tax=Bolinopsis microptera TaxID=2820187 RepID=UPI003078ACDC
MKGRVGRHQNYTCKGEQVKCPGGLQCIWENYICDGEEDCIDGSDENGTFCKGFTCIEYNMVKCPGGLQCIQENYICNGEEDCIDGSDENGPFCKGGFELKYLLTGFSYADGC